MLSVHLVLLDMQVIINVVDFGRAAELQKKSAEARRRGVQ